MEITQIVDSLRRAVEMGEVSDEHISEICEKDLESMPMTDRSVERLRKILHIIEADTRRHVDVVKGIINKLDGGLE